MQLQWRWCGVGNLCDKSIENSWPIRDKGRNRWKIYGARLTGNVHVVVGIHSYGFCSIAPRCNVANAADGSGCCGKRQRRGPAGDDGTPRSIDCNLICKVIVRTTEIRRIK